MKRRKRKNGENMKEKERKWKENGQIYVERAINAKEGKETQNGCVLREEILP
jgi:hypothetical protein